MNTATWICDTIARRRERENPVELVMSWTSRRAASYIPTHLRWTADKSLIAIDRFADLMDIGDLGCTPLRSCAND